MTVDYCYRQGEITKQDRFKPFSLVLINPDGAEMQIPFKCGRTISVARYSKHLTTSESFHLDTLRMNLKQRFRNSDFQLLRIDPFEIQGITGLKYIRQKGQKFEQSVMFVLDTNVVSINTRGRDSIDVVFQDIIV